MRAGKPWLLDPHRVRDLGPFPALLARERNHEILRSMKGSYPPDISLRWLLDPLKNALPGENPVFINGMDL